jgi:hypothetical protein
MPGAAPSSNIALAVMNLIRLARACDMSDPLHEMAVACGAVPALPGCGKGLNGPGRRCRREYQLRFEVCNNILKTPCPPMESSPHEPAAVFFLPD